MSFDDKVPPPAFRSPTALPASSVEATVWQEHNRRWWEQHPMRYDWGEAVEHPVGSREFYEEVDWEGGDDPQHSTYIPVESDTEIEALKETTPSGLLQFVPRLQKDYPKDAEQPTVRWIK